MTRLNDSWTADPLGFWLRHRRVRRSRFVELALWEPSCLARVQHTLRDRGVAGQSLELAACVRPTALFASAFNCHGCLSLSRVEGAYRRVALSAPCLSLRRGRVRSGRFPVAPLLSKFYKRPRSARSLVVGRRRLLDGKCVEDGL